MHPGTPYCQRKGVENIADRNRAFFGVFPGQKKRGPPSKKCNVLLDTRFSVPGVSLHPFINRQVDVSIDRQAYLVRSLFDLLFLAFWHC